MHSEGKIAFMCNAHCSKRYETSPEEVLDLEKDLSRRGYDVRTKGCLSVCDIVRKPYDSFRQQAIVNVVLIDGNTERQLVAGKNQSGKIGMMNPRHTS